MAEDKKDDNNEDKKDDNAPDDKDNDNELDKSSADKKSGMQPKTLIFILIGCVSLLIITIIVLIIFLKPSQSEPPEEKVHVSEQTEESVQEPIKPKPAMYHKIEPAFIVNFEGTRNIKFLQITVEVMTRDKQTLEAIENNIPLIKNHLVQLFSSQQYTDISLASGRERLRKKAFEIVKKIIEDETGSDQVEDVLFTSFVMQ